MVEQLTLAHGHAPIAVFEGLLAAAPPGLVVLHLALPKLPDPDGELTPAAAALLPDRLPALQQLSIEARSVPPCLAGCLARLQLTSLDLDVTLGLPAGFEAGLAGLAGTLAELRLECQAAIKLQTLAGFARLQHCDLRAYGGDHCAVQVGWGLCDRTLLMLTRCCGWHARPAAQRREGNARPLTGARRPPTPCRTAQIGDASCSHITASTAPLRSLAVQGLRPRAQERTPLLPPLLAGLLPPGAQPLQRLDLESVPLEAAEAVACAPAFAHLLELSLCECPGAEDALQQLLLPAAPSLTALRLRQHDMSVLPEALLGLAGLRSLTLDGLAWPELPEGPWMAGELRHTRCAPRCPALHATL